MFGFLIRFFVWEAFMVKNSACHGRDARAEFPIAQHAARYLDVDVDMYIDTYILLSHWRLKSVYALTQLLSSTQAMENHLGSFFWLSSSILTTIKNHGHCKYLNIVLVE